VKCLFWLCHCYLCGSHSRYGMELGCPTFVPVCDPEMGFEKIVRIAHARGGTSLHTFLKFPDSCSSPEPEAAIDNIYSFFSLQEARHYHNYEGWAGTSCWVHGRIFTSADLYSRYWQSWCKCGMCLTISFFLTLWFLDYLDISDSWLVLSALQVLSLTRDRFTQYTLFASRSIIISLVICTHHSENCEW